MASSQLQKTLEVLHAVVRIDRPASLGELSKLVDLPKTTVHRILLALSESDMLLRENNGHGYTVAPQIARFALDVLLHSSLRGIRHAALQRLVDEIGETCNFTMRDGNEVVYIDRVEAEWPLRLHFKPGSRVPIHCTSSGKLLLSAMPAAGRKQLLSAISLTRYTDKTITDPVQLEAELKLIRKKGYAVDDEGFLAGLISVAVPVEGRSGQVIGTLAVHAPNARLSLERAIDYVPLLQQTADMISLEPQA